MIFSVGKITKLKVFVRPAILTVAVFFAVFQFSCFADKPQTIPFTNVRTIFNPAEKFGEPFGIVEKNGEIFFSDGAAGKIRRVSNYQNFTVVSDKFDTPSAIVFDDKGDLIVADSGAHTIKKVNIETGETEVIAGVENNSGFSDGEANSALFNAPVGVAVGEGGKIFVADTYNDKIRVIENGRVSTVAGSEQGFADDFVNLAKFDTPCGIAVLLNGNLIVADSKNRRVRLIEPDGKVSTIAGNGEQNSIDGSPLSASFVEPTAITVDKHGVIYIADGNSIRVLNRRIFPFVETITDVRRGFSDGSPRRARFNRPSGLTADAAGNLFVADAENQSIRVLTSAELGTEMSAEAIKKLRVTPEEFRRLGEPRWTFNPPDRARDVAGTIGEIRGEITEDKRAWFHNGFDIAGAYGEAARFVRSEKVLRPSAAENFATLRELIRMPTLGYIHIRLGRDASNKPFDDARFQFSFDENRKLNGVRIRRGAKFGAGEVIGTLNAFNHVHLIAGGSGAEMNALDALIFPNIADMIAPTIEKVSLFDENWREIETEKTKERIKLAGKTRIVARAFDRMNGNGRNRKLGVYRLGYQILRADNSPLSDIQWTISFDRPPDEDAINLVYAAGSQSGYTPQTIFNYIVSNQVNDNEVRQDFFDAGALENGNYTLRVFAADFFQNNTTRDIDIEIIK
ncbi:MAG TPA: hypothetical protein VNI84_14350 [Pyrinomonadaceae bacterium]|nr:hypothetical protein [Pyrinomonadaceae bacterium]